MIAFIGLGNPGDKYANTKHNAGYWVLDELANRQKLGFKPGKGDYIFAQNQKSYALTRYYLISLIPKEGDP